MTAPAAHAESSYAWIRLAVALALMTIGGAGMYSMSVALPPLQAEFGIARAQASLPYTFTMIGFGFGGILMGKLADRFGVRVPVLIGAVCLALGFIVAGVSQNLLQFSAAQGLLIGLLGTSATYIGTGVFCLIAMPLLALALKGKPPAIADASAPARSAPSDPDRPLGFSPRSLQTLLCIAGVSCCVAMSMPQVHMVAYCGDLGYAAARGAEMLSLMLGFG